MGEYVRLLAAVQMRTVSIPRYTTRQVPDEKTLRSLSKQREEYYLQFVQQIGIRISLSHDDHLHFTRFVLAMECAISSKEMSIGLRASGIGMTSLASSDRCIFPSSPLTKQRRTGQRVPLDD
jgi:hypothetical protein